HKFVEIPILAVCANFSWEFLWSWVFTTDMGLVYVWGYRIWFFLDVFILISLFRFGYKQIRIPSMVPYSKLIIGAGLAAWFYMLYFYIKIYDAPISHMGIYSGYILNVFMSALYIPTLLGLRDQFPFSRLVAWAKGVGTFLITIFGFLRFDDPFLISMMVVTTVLDATYITLFELGNKNPKAA
ncbi:MAG: hypothetical protein AAFQ98_20925, partial [Bacteroidota bacterium]